jgi:uncharacterized protein YbjQ (UPF0145 family)
LASVLSAASWAVHAGIADWGLVTNQDVLAKSASMPAYAKANAAAETRDPKVLGRVSASVCSFTDDAAAAQAATLSQLKARAYLMGANGLVDVSYQLANVSARSTCYHRGYEATGTAVVFN